MNKILSENENKPFIEIKCKSHNDWLSKRKLGGSSASICLDLNPYRNKRDLYDELTNSKKEDSSTNELTIYGHKAEAPIRELFKLHHPEYQVIDPNDEQPTILQSKENPFMTVTLDGTLIRLKDNAKGVYEGKTCHIRNNSQMAEWKDQIPQTYYCQICHELAVTGYTFAILVVELIHERYDEKGIKNSYSQIKEYYFERNESMEEDIKILVNAEKDFNSKYLEKGLRPKDTIVIDL